MSLGRITLVILITLPILGGILGGFLLSLGVPPSPWESLGNPPSPAESFQSISPQLLIESVDGDLFAYSGSVYGWKSYEGEVQLPSNEYPGTLCEGVKPPSIGKVIDSGERCLHWGLGYSYSKFVILSDGTVWEWSSQYGDESGIMLVFIYILGGAALFLIIAILILAVVHFNALINRLEERARSRES